MIPFDFITEWRAHAPWVKDVQVEQDLLLSRAVVELFNREEVARTLAFRGGTALYKLHIRPAARYSEDIDLVQAVAGPIGKAIDAVRDALDSWLGEPQRTLKEGTVTLLYRMRGDGSPMKLKVEINSREHFAVLGFEERRFDVASRWFSGSAKIRTYALDELLGTKLRALYQRKKGRDIFDLWIASRRAKIDPARIVYCFMRYMEQEGSKVSRAEMEMNLDEKLTAPKFVADIGPLLAPDIKWDLQAAADYIHRELVPHLPGDPWKGAKKRRK